MTRAPEIITCGATPRLPAPRTKNPCQAQTAQPRSRYFVSSPRASAAECAHAPGLPTAQELQIHMPFLDSHGIPVRQTSHLGTGVRPIFPRAAWDSLGGMETARRGGPAEQGHPGDFNCYREFYRDGLRSDYNHIRPYLHDDGVRRGIRVNTTASPAASPWRTKIPTFPPRPNTPSRAGNFL